MSVSEKVEFVTLAAQDPKMLANDSRSLSNVFTVRATLGITRTVCVTSWTLFGGPRFAHVHEDSAPMALAEDDLIGCPRTDPATHPAEGWCYACPRVVMYRKITARERRRGYVYPWGHIESTACRIYLSGLGNVYEADGGAAFIIDGCAHVAFVGAL